VQGMLNIRRIVEGKSRKAVERGAI